MQADDSGVHEAGSACSSEGASPVHIRLTQDLHARGAEEPAEGVLADSASGEDALAPRDVCGGGGGSAVFEFVSDALLPAVVDVAVLESFAYALFDIESCIEELESLLQRLARTICVSVIRAFMRGGRPGLVTLHKVLPNVFRTFCVPSPHDVLIQCGLVPVYPDTVCEFPSFFFQPDLDGCWMIEQDSGKAEHRTMKRKRSSEPIKTSAELQQAYVGVRVGWSSASNS